MKLAVVTNPVFFVEEDKIITQLFENGLDYLILQKDEKEPIYYERLLNLMSKKYHKRIFICDNPAIQEEYKLAGTIYISKNIAKPEKPKGKKICYANSLKQIQELKKDNDIICFGPLGYTFTQSLELKEKGSKIINKKVWAYGNIDINNVRKLKKFNFGCLILNKLLWSRFDTQRATDYSNLIQYFKRIRKLTN